MIALILGIALVGLIVYLVVTFIPMPPMFKTIIMVIAAIVLILYIASVFGIMDIPVPRAR